MVQVVELGLQVAEEEGKAFVEERPGANLEEEEKEEKGEGGGGDGDGGGGVFAAEARKAHEAGRAKLRASLKRMWREHGATLDDAEARALVEGALGGGEHLVAAVRTMDQHATRMLIEEED